MKVYINGYFEYRVDNPAALADAARFTPSEVADDAGALGAVPAEAWDANALLVEVSKRAALNPPPPPPGTEMVDQQINWSLAPPRTGG